MVAALFTSLLVPVLAGDEPDDWKTEANARIEQIRKRDAYVLVVDELGEPQPGAAVTATQTRRHFAFGSEIGFALAGDETYRHFFLDHFEWAVFGNESKWFFNEPYRDMENYVKADTMLDILEQHGIPTRGHCLFWAKEQFTPPWCRSLPEEELREEVDERIDHGVEHFRNRFLHWDINNEMLDGTFFRDRLGPEIRPHMFTRSHQVDPGALLFVNDYSIIAGSASRTQRYIDQIEGLIADGAPVHGIGVQGHFWGDTVDPHQILARLDQLSVLGLPIWITEYDAVDSDPVERGEKLESCYRAAFSHPSVEGILMWGFWGGNHWRGPDAAIVDEDWTLNAAGVKYEELMEEWSTEAAGETGPDGRFRFRGFHGLYDLVVEPPGGGDPIAVPLDLAFGSELMPVMVPLVPGSCFPAPEVEGLAVTEEAGGLARIRWLPLPWREDMGRRYDLLRSSEPADFDAAAACLESDDGSDTAAEDGEAPPADSAWFYLARGEYLCADGEGTLGAGRAGRSCDAP
jgi:GH35 family endo-1,4-beta-xylanase